MLIKLTSRLLALTVTVGWLPVIASASVVVESSFRATWALAGTSDTGGGLDTDSSSAIGPLTLSSSMGPTEFTVESSVTMVSCSSALGISGSISLSQRGLDDGYSGYLDRFVAYGSVSHTMTFVVDVPTPYRMEVVTLSSTWEVQPIYGLAIAAGVATSLDDGSTVVLHQVVPPVIGASCTEGILQPGRYTGLFFFSSAYFGPNAFDLSTASLAYSLTIPTPSASIVLAVAGFACARRRSRTRTA